MVVLRKFNRSNLRGVEMKNIYFQGIVLIAILSLSFQLLRQVNWVELLQVEEIKDQTEEQIGDLFWENVESSSDINLNPYVNNAIDSVVDALCTANSLDRAHIKTHVIYSEEINAFALPNGHLVIYTGLIDAADSPEELCGVIGHEIAHIELDHVMKKMVKELGYSVVFSASGRTGKAISGQIARSISSLAMDRELEREADYKSVDYLSKAGFDATPLADFLYKTARTSSAGKYLSWISTHPDSKERAEYIITYAREKKKPTKKVLSAETWNTMKELAEDQD